jgi:hypothetical protein
MSRRYYENFPQAPVAVIARIAAVACPTVIDVRACRDTGLIVEVLLEGGLGATILLDIAEAIGCPEEDAFVGDIFKIDGTEDRIYSLEFLSSEFDFSALFPGFPVWDKENSVTDELHRILDGLEDLLRDE